MEGNPGPAILRDCLGKNLTQLVSLLQQEANSTEAAVDIARQQMRDLQEDVNHFFIIQMTITVFGKSYGTSLMSFSNADWVCLLGGRKHTS